MQRRRAPSIRSVWRWAIALSIVLVVGSAVAGYEIHHLQTEFNGVQQQFNSLNQEVASLYRSATKTAQPAELPSTTTTTVTSPPSTTTTMTTVPVATVPVATATSLPTPPSPAPPVVAAPSTTSLAAPPMAFTGANTGLTGSLGALLILAGLALVVLARRRLLLPATQGPGLSVQLPWRLPANSRSVADYLPPPMTRAARRLRSTTAPIRSGKDGGADPACGRTTTTMTTVLVATAASLPTPPSPAPPVVAAPSTTSLAAPPMAFTGANTGLTASVGALLIVAGLALVVLARRRLLPPRRRARA
jgi:hypothetical protein